jgi:hypothetical protein
MNSRAFAIPAVYLMALLAFSGCNVPQWRVFQSKVPAPLVKSAVQIEAERAGADLVARTIEKPVELVPVAQKLSESLGAPEHPITQANTTTAAKDALDGLREGIKAKQHDLDKQNKLLAQYEGKKIEGTGVNVFGFAVSLPVIGLIALCIFFPGALGILLRMFLRVRGALKATIAAGQAFKEENPAFAKSFNDTMTKAQDQVHQAIVKKIKAKLPSKG